MSHTPKTLSILPTLTLDAGVADRIRGTLVGSPERGYSLSWSERGILQYSSLASFVTGKAADRSQYWHFVNGDKTDYRVENLELRHRRENPKTKVRSKADREKISQTHRANRTSRQHANKNGYTGVLASVNGTRFYARIWNLGIMQTLGAFDTAEEAARAYDDELARRGLARVNFPDDQASG